MDNQNWAWGVAYLDTACSNYGVGIIQDVQGFENNIHVNIFIF